MNLHPEFAVPEAELHADHAFPWLRSLHGLTASLFPEGTGDRKIVDLSTRMLGGNVSAVRVWPLTRKAWSLSRGANSEQLVRLALAGLPEQVFPSPNRTLHDALLHLCKMLTEPAFSAMVPGGKAFMDDARAKFPDEYGRFIQWFRDEHWETQEKGFFDVFEEYFAGYADYSQLLPVVLNGLPFDITDVASSSDFQRTRMYYGNVFEIVTGAYHFLAAVGNIAAGRPFDQFLKMTMDKYLEIDKPNRSRPLETVPALAAFTQFLDGQLRNSSHHRKLILTGNKVRVRTKKHDERVISYAEYLRLCNGITSMAAGLLSLMLQAIAKAN